MMSKCGKNKKVADEPLGECDSDVLIPHFDVICNLLLNDLNRCVVTWNILNSLLYKTNFVLYNN